MIRNQQVSGSSPLAAFSLKISALTSFIGFSRRGAENRRPNAGLLLSCFFISRSAGLIYQVAWSKSLGLVFGHTVYAVATVLAAFYGRAGFGKRSAGPLGRGIPECLGAVRMA
jgi:hypothetical protein